MKLRRLEIVRSPDAPEYVRLEAEVVYADRPSRPEVYWIEVDERFASDLSLSGNAWLACLLPLAMTLHEPLQLTVPVDRQLFQNAERLMEIWADWYPDRQVVPIEAELLAENQLKAQGRIGAFFSGGVDSFFTLLHHDQEALAASLPRIDDLITVWGFDIPIDNARAFDNVRRSSAQVASQLEKQLIIVGSNFRKTRLSQLRWLSHFGSLLIGLGLGLEDRFAKLLISSAYGSKNQKPISGSHPRTDPLLSTSKTSIVHYAQDHDRFERTAYISRSKIAMATLRVCWESPTGANCGTCDKCIRTMATLDLLGGLHLSSTLPVERYNLGKLERAYSGAQRVYYLSLKEHAEARGRSDIVSAIERNLARSRRLDRWTQLPRLLRINQRLKSSYPGLWSRLRPLRSASKALLRRLTGATI